MVAGLAADGCGSAFLPSAYVRSPQQERTGKKELLLHGGIQLLN